MKELSIEEKAKRYDEAIERSKNFIENGDERERTIAESIFAGIMEESEDERIRKELLSFCQNRADNYPNDPKYSNIGNWIAWLEKQGDTKETLCDKCRKEQPSHSCQDITELGRCALEKQGEQKPAWSTKDCQMIEEILFLIEEYRKSNRCTDEEDMQNSVTCEDWLKSLKERVVPQPKQEWNEVDEEWLTTVIGDYNFNRTSNNDTITQIKINWLKSLKERITQQPQQKREWSEEGDLMLKSFVNLVEMYYGDCIDKTEKNKMLDWLKSLRPKSHWKPSDEQIYSLERVLNFYGKGTAVYDSVKEVLEQLKKL